MSAWSKILVLCVLLLLGAPSCTYYTEKQTEAVSQTVYATKDSIDKARFDLADEYATQATRIIKPPKNRIEISHLTTSVPQTQHKTENNDSKSKQTRTPVIVVPERLRGLAVIVVNSEEYKSLLEDKEAHQQLKIDYENLKTTKQAVDEELITQIKHRDKMIADLNEMKETLANKNLVIMKLSLISAALGAALVTGIILRIKGIL